MTFGVARRRLTATFTRIDEWTEAQRAYMSGA